MTRFLKTTKAKIATGISVAVASIHIAHALTLDRSIQYVEVPFTSGRIPASLDGYRIAFVTDAHYVSTKTLEKIVQKLNTKNIDLLLLGGDNPSYESGELQAAIKILSRTITTDGIFGIEGNHDIRPHLFNTMLSHGMTPLFNNGVHIREDFFLAGTSCLKRTRPISANIAKSIENAKQDDFVLLISHQPDIVMQQSTQGVDLVLAGHTHGGQITFFGLWAPALTIPTFNVTDYGQQFMSGWAQSRDGTPVYISNGIAEQFFRMFARPQVIIITLKR